MTDLERLALLQVMDFLILTTPPGYATLAQRDAAVAKIRETRVGLEGEGYAAAVSVGAAL